ncbi:MAG TPA: DUF1080 domain-containing protein [Lacunisphaera sp.]
MITPKAFLGQFVFALFAAGSLMAAETDWRPLFNGHDLTGWETFMTKPDSSWNVAGLKRDAAGKYLEPVGRNNDPLKVFTVEQEKTGAVIHVSGQGFGVMTTRESFENFHLRVQVKWGEKKWGSKVNSPRDCGLLYFVHGEPGFDHETWPRSIEFQIQEHDMGDLYALGTQITVNARPETGPKGRTLYRYDAKGTPTLFVQKLPIGNRCMREVDAEKPKGEWNTLDLICFNGDSIHIVNGKVVMRLRHAERLDGANPAPLVSGQISLQTEGAEVYYRNVEIQPISAVPAGYAEK